MKHYDKRAVLFVLNIGGMAAVICPASKITLTGNDSQRNSTVISLYAKDKQVWLKNHNIQFYSNISSSCFGCCEEQAV